MIVVVGGIKGGSGKTTISTNLAVLASYDNKEILLVDADDQETAYDFSSLRNSLEEKSIAKYTCIKLTGKSVRSEVLKLKDKYSHIIIDTGGRDTMSQRAAMSIADILLVPFVPRSFDLWTLDSVTNLVEEIKQINPNLIFCTFLNKADSRGLDNHDAQTILQEVKNLDHLSDVIICNRKSFSNSSSEGKSVIESKPSDTKANYEIRNLYKNIFK